MLPLFFNTYHMHRLSQKYKTPVVPHSHGFSHMYLEGLMNTNLMFCTLYSNMFNTSHVFLKYNVFRVKSWAGMQETTLIFLAKILSALHAIIVIVEN